MPHSDGLNYWKCITMLLIIMWFLFKDQFTINKQWFRYWLVHDRQKNFTGTNNVHMASPNQNVLNTWLSFHLNGTHSLFNIPSTLSIMDLNNGFYVIGLQFWTDLWLEISSCVFMQYSKINNISLPAWIISMSENKDSTFREIVSFYIYIYIYIWYTNMAT